MSVVYKINTLTCQQLCMLYISKQVMANVVRFSLPLLQPLTRGLQTADVINQTNLQCLTYLIHGCMEVEKKKND